MSVEENNQKVLKEITEAIAAEEKAKREARTAILKAINVACTGNNGASAHLFAQAFAQLRDPQPIPTPMHFHPPNAFGGGLSGGFGGPRIPNPIPTNPNPSFGGGDHG